MHHVTSTRLPVSRAGPFKDRALVLNSNLAEAWFFGGWVKNWLGEPEPALERFARLGRRIAASRAARYHRSQVLDRGDKVIEQERRLPPLDPKRN
jgi:hypothetical protein